MKNHVEVVYQGCTLEERAVKEGTFALRKEKARKILSALLCEKRLFDDQVEAERWILNFCIHYYLCSETFRFRKRPFRAFFDRVWRQSTSGSFLTYAIFPHYNLQVEKRLVLNEEVSVVPLEQPKGEYTLSGLDQSLKKKLGIHSCMDVRVYQDSPYFFGSSLPTAVTVRKSQNSSVFKFNIADVLVLVTALRLFKAGRVGLWRYYTVSDAWYSIAMSGGELPNLSTPIYRFEQRPLVIEGQEHRQFKKLWRSIQCSLSAPDKKLEIACRYFNSSYNKVDQTSKFLDMAISMEALFSASTEVSYRMSLRVSHLLGVTEDEVLRTYRDVRQIYSIRSSIAHGRAAEKYDLAEYLCTLENIVALSIVCYCEAKEEGLWPAKKSFDEELIVKRNAPLRNLVRRTRALSTRVLGASSP